MHMYAHVEMALRLPTLPEHNNLQAWQVAFLLSRVISASIGRHTGPRIDVEECLADKS